METPDTPDDPAALRRANQAAWDVVAAKYAPEVERDVELLRSGGTSLLPPELDALTPLARRCGRAIHLQCSHGLDALSLWKLGAREIVGLDLSERMLSLARRKAELLGAPATWHHADVLAPPAELAGTAELVYTGKGALPWVLDLARWAGVVARLLAPGGHVYFFEGHPLNWVWMHQAAELRLRPDGDYFTRSTRVNDDFPGLFLQRAAAEGAGAAQAFERQWTLGEVVSALADAGLVLVRLDEYPEHFWPQFPHVPPDALGRVPHTFSLLMRRPAA
jgi:SAM-dependent methyltransferase